MRSLPWLPEVFASPMSGSCFISSRLTVVTGAEICSTFRILVLPEVFVVPVSIGYLFDFLAFLTQHNELLLRPFGGLLGLVETGIGFSHVAYSSSG